MDYAQKNYISYLEWSEVYGIVRQSARELTEATESEHEPLKMGWALKVQKASGQFVPKIRNFLIDKFEQGATSGRKFEAKWVAKEMQEMQIAGEPYFQKSEYLTENQIRSYWSRYSAQVRAQGTRQITAAAGPTEVAAAAVCWSNRST